MDVSYSNIGGCEISKAELRADGWWLLFEEGEEAGPFLNMDEATLFLDYVDNLQQNLKKDMPADSNSAPSSPPLHPGTQLGLHIT